MNIQFVSGGVSEQTCDFLIVPAFEADSACSMPAIPSEGDVLKEIDEALSGILFRSLKEEAFNAKPSQIFILPSHGLFSARRIAVVGLGPRRKFVCEILRQSIGRAIKAAQRVGAKTICAALPDWSDHEGCVKATAEGLLLGSYRFDRYKSANSGSKPENSRAIGATILVRDNTEIGDSLQDTLDTAIEIGSATNWARELVNEPPNVLTPSELARVAKKMARERGLKVSLLDQSGIERLQMGMFLAVARGSRQPPALIRISWVPAGRDAKKPPLAFIGKAVTFDSGGLCLKPADSMLDMKTDMAGAAAVLAAMRVVAKIKPRFPVHGFIGACENMPGPDALRPGEILVSRLGKTVEIANTDAEGRLVLGDILALAAETKPALMVDIATLTGACAVALGRNIAGVFGSSETAVWEVLDAARAAGEEVWPLPTSELQREAIESEVADLKNSGERWGGAINGALFLKEFVGEIPWVHMDIAGPARSSKERGYCSKGGTGFGARTLVEIVRAHTKPKPATLVATSDAQGTN